MNITMDDSRLLKVTQLQEFLKASQKVVVSISDSPLEEKYSQLLWIFLTNIPLSFSTSIQIEGKRQLIMLLQIYCNRLLSSKQKADPIIQETMPSLKQKRQCYPQEHGLGTH